MDQHLHIITPSDIEKMYEFKFIFGLTPLWQQTGCTAEIFISQSRAIFSPNCDSFQLATSTQVFSILQIKK